MTKELLAEAGPLGRRPGLRGADGARPRGLARGRSGAAGGCRRGRRARARGPRGRAPLRARGRLSDALRGLRDHRGRDRAARGGAGERLRCWPSSRRAPSTPRAAARCPTAGSWRRPRAARGWWTSTALGDDQALALEPVEGEIGAGESVPRAGRARHAARDHAQPHRHPPAARRAARAPRAPRAPGGLLRRARTSCASTSPTASA